MVVLCVEDQVSIRDAGRRGTFRSEDAACKTRPGAPIIHEPSVKSQDRRRPRSSATTSVDERLLVLDCGLDKLSEFSTECRLFMLERRFRSVKLMHSLIRTENFLTLVRACATYRAPPQ